MAKKNVRISGVGLKQQERFTTYSNGSCDVDIEQINALIKDYLISAQNLRKYSISGLCIALDITRERLNMWLKGYFKSGDDIRCARNERLASCLRMGLLHIQRHWEESDKPNALRIKQLEATGALDCCRAYEELPCVDLGKLKKFAR